MGQHDTNEGAAWAVRRQSNEAKGEQRLVSRDWLGEAAWRGMDRRSILGLALIQPGRGACRAVVLQLEALALLADSYSAFFPCT